MVNDTDKYLQIELAKHATVKAATHLTDPAVLHLPAQRGRIGIAAEPCTLRAVLLHVGMRVVVGVAAGNAVATATGVAVAAGPLPGALVTSNSGNAVVVSACGMRAPGQTPRGGRRRRLLSSCWLCMLW